MKHNLYIATQKFLQSPKFLQSHIYVELFWIYVNIKEYSAIFFLSFNTQKKYYIKQANFREGDSFSIVIQNTQTQTHI